MNQNWIPCKQGGLEDKNFHIITKKYRRRKKQNRKEELHCLKLEKTHSSGIAV